MLFCKSGDVSSGFVGIKDGVEYCYFDVLAVIIGIAILFGLLVIYFFNRFAKSQKNEQGVKK